MKTKNLGDIYPLTIVGTRFGSHYVIFNLEADSEMILDVQADEEISYDIPAYLHKAYFPFIPKFGIGGSIEEAFLDYQRREILADGTN